MFTTPQGDTMISLPSHNVSAPAGLAWLDTTTPHTEARYMEKQLVNRAELPVYSLFVPTTQSLYLTGLLRAAATRYRAGGVAVL